MSVESGVLVGRRSRGEIERLVGQYGSSGMGRAEFCRSQVLALSTLGRHLRKQQSKPGDVRSKGVERSGLMAVEVAAPVVSMADSEVSSTRMVLWINGRRVELGRGFDAETLTQLVAVLERL
jgi:hypothetical protein